MRLLGFIMILFLVSICISCEKPEGIDIPDNNFLTALIRNGADKNMDGVITSAEAETVISLDISHHLASPWNKIESADGLEAFVNLETFICKWNNLTQLNLENNKLLKVLDCEYNQITSVDISKNPALENLDCSLNQLTTLDVSNNTALRSLDCTSNQLFYLDVSNNLALEELKCTDNQIISLDFSNNDKLVSLDCSYNQLTSLDVSNNAALYDLRCGANYLNSLDLSNNIALEGISLKHMKSLQKVCVWTMPFPPTGVNVDTDFSPNVYFTTDCGK